MAMSIEIDAQIENLRGLKSDLEECYWSISEAGNSEVRFAVGVAIEQLGQRIGALEAIVRHHGSPEVDFGHATPAEVRAIDLLLEVLDRELVLEPGQFANRFWPQVRQVLAAADDLMLVAARGVAGQRQATRQAVILPLVRSGR
jgi:hypothetical protein